MPPKALRVSVTGTQRTPLHGVRVVAHGLITLADDERFTVSEFSTGAAHGADTIAFYEGVQRFPDALHRVAWPEGYACNLALVREATQAGCGGPSDALRGRVVTTAAVPGGYMARNDALVDYADLLLAFPATSTEIQRSGTWATVRRARARGIPVWGFAFDGTIWREFDDELVPA